MKKKYKDSNVKKIDRLYFIVITIIVAFQFISSRDSEIMNLISDQLKMYVGLKAIGMRLIAFGASVVVMYFFAMFKIIPITLIYFAIRYVSIKHYKDKLETVDFKNDNYYREIIKTASPAVLDYIDDFVVDEKTVVASIMGLELKKIIEVKDKIYVINDSYEGLDENEKYILEQIKNNTLKSINLNTFMYKIVEDCIRKKLIIQKAVSKRKIILSIVFKVVQFIAMILIFNYSIVVINENVLDDTMILLSILTLFILMTVIMIYPVAIIISTIGYIAISQEDPFLRSDEGREINNKLEGLKKYIKDFSNLDEKTKEALVLWEDYLIYSVMFGNNVQLVKEYLTKI